MKYSTYSTYPVPVQRSRLHEKNSIILYSKSLQTITESILGVADYKTISIVQVLQDAVSGGLTSIKLCKGVRDEKQNKKKTGPFLLCTRF